MLASWFYSLWSHEKEVLVLGKNELRVECVEGKDFAELDIVSLSFYNLSAIPTPQLSSTPGFLTTSIPREKSNLINENWRCYY